MPQKTEKNQAVVIPDDWGGEDWFCIRLQWPNSPRWISVLTGLMSQPLRGRFWNENTGIVTEAQTVGGEIWDRNILFNPCYDDNGNIDTPSQCGGGGLVLVPSEWIENMITDVEFDCTTGILTFKSGMCCVKEINLSCLQAGTIGTDEDPYDPPAVQQACGKASGMVDMLWTVLDAGWDAQGYFPTTWVGRVEDSVPGYDLSDTACWSLVQQSVDLDNDYSKSEVLTEYRKQQMKCLLVSLLDETTVGITQTQYDAFRGLASVVFEGEQRQWALTGIEAFGKGNMSNIAALSAPVSADCSCPDAPQIYGPSAGGWYWEKDADYTFDYQDNFVNTFANSKIQAQHDVYGVVIRVTSLSSPSNLNKYKRSNDPQDVYNVYMFGIQSDNYSGTWQDWHAQVDPDIATEVLALLPGTAYNHTPQFASSETIAAPSATAGQIALASYNFGSASGDHTGTCEIWWLYNQNSPSHQ